MRGLEWISRDARLVRFDPEALRQQSTLLPEQQLSTFFENRGFGLPGVYDLILGRGDQAFHQLSDNVRSLFPTVSRIMLPATSQSHKQIAVELRDGTVVRAQHMSEGLLYYLAFAAIPFVTPASILLVEEPENGLHPTRIADIVHMLRELTKTGVQVIMATHSPLVINELQPEEVSLVRRPSVERGTVVTPINETPNFAQRSKTFALGELWVSYANGTDDLLQDDSNNSEPVK
jgi:predicted ATPase